TGGRVEALVVAPALTVAAFVLAFLVVPGVAPLLLELRAVVESLLATTPAPGQERPVGTARIAAG
ncbi:MAG: hypothetical protein NTW05_00725, partial [Pseudonocardiales bacterium]|nr:hypothetical protein [Pseudonocardiales bacterium]